VNFVVLAITLPLFPGSIALAVTGLAADTIATLLFWRFYSKNARVLMSETISPAPV
jgi:hypothetical protein